jgi:signal transduction histidine kinase
MVGGWHAAFGVLAALAGGLLLAGAGVSPNRQHLALALLAAACGWYLAVGRRAMRAEFCRTGLIYVVVAIPLTVGLFAAAPSGGIAFCILYPHIWRLLSARRAAFASVVTAVATAVAALAWTGLGAAQLESVGAVAVASVLAALLIGLWISRIIRQSRSRAALITELAATRAELAELSRAAGAAAERERLAHDIHDTLTQGFASIVLLLEAAEAQLGTNDGAALAHLRNARKTAQENIAEARAMITALCPPHLRDASLPAALRQLVDRAEAEPGARPELTVAGQPRPLEASAEVVLLRVTQEALANVRRHAAASRVDVKLAYDHDAVTLRVADDGRGFDPGSQAAGFGLRSMRARVAQVGGAVLVRSSPGAGTTIQVRLPVASPAPVMSLAPAAEVSQCQSG